MTFFGTNLYKICTFSVTSLSKTNIVHCCYSNMSKKQRSIDWGYWCKQQNHRQCANWGWTCYHADCILRTHNPYDTSGTTLGTIYLSCEVICHNSISPVNTWCEASITDVKCKKDGDRVSVRMNATMGSCVQNEILYVLNHLRWQQTWRIWLRLTSWP